MYLLKTKLSLILKGYCYFQDMVSCISLSSCADIVCTECMINAYQHFISIECIYSYFVFNLIVKCLGTNLWVLFYGYLCDLCSCYACLSHI